jgi:hypothetical protein
MPDKTLRLYPQYSPGKPATVSVTLPPSRKETGTNKMNHEKLEIHEKYEKIIT